jgi:hypothetical protein
MANGTVQNTSGYVHFNISYKGTLVHKQKFTILPDLPVPFILGVDFMTITEAQRDFKKDTIYLPNHKLTLDFTSKNISHIMAPLRLQVSTGLVSPLLWLQRNYHMVTSCRETFHFVLQNCMSAVALIRLSLNTNDPVEHVLRRTTNPVRFQLISDWDNYFSQGLDVYRNATALEQSFSSRLNSATAMSIRAGLSRQWTIPSPDTIGANAFRVTLCAYADLIRRLHLLARCVLSGIDDSYRTLPLDTISLTNIRHYVTLSETIMETVDWPSLTRLVAELHTNLPWSPLVDTGFTVGLRR